MYEDIDEELQYTLDRSSGDKTLQPNRPNSNVAANTPTPPNDADVTEQTPMMDNRHSPKTPRSRRMDFAQQLDVSQRAPSDISQTVVPTDP